MELEQMRQLTLGLRAAPRRGVAKSYATGRRELWPRSTGA